MKDKVQTVQNSRGDKGTKRQNNSPISESSIFARQQASTSKQDTNVRKTTKREESGQANRAIEVDK